MTSRARRLTETLRDLATTHQNPGFEHLAQELEGLGREITPGEEKAAIEAAADLLRPRASLKAERSPEAAKAPETRIPCPMCAGTFAPGTPLIRCPHGYPPHARCSRCGD